MIQSKIETKRKSNSGCDAEPETTNTVLSPAAETASDLATESSDKEMGEPSRDGSLTTTSTLDPICGMAVDESSALHEERDGKTFYFCSDQCRKKFLATIAGAKSDSKSGSCCG